jgi:hypothetical protein
VHILEHRSGAPFTKSDVPSRRVRTAAEYALGLEGDLDEHLGCRPRAASGRGRAGAATRSAASVGSPWVSNPPSVRLGGGSLVSDAGQQRAGRPASGVAGRRRGRAGAPRGPRDRHRDARPPRPDLLHRHPVLGERAGLVGADDRRAAERLDGRQPAHDRVAAGHPADAEREGDREDDRQALGDRGHRERDGHHEHVGEALAERHADDEGDEGRDADDDAR